MIGRSGERGSGIYVLPARHDDDDNDIYLRIFVYIHLHSGRLGFNTRSGHIKDFKNGT